MWHVHTSLMEIPVRLPLWSLMIFHYHYRILLLYQNFKWKQWKSSLHLQISFTIRDLQQHMRSTKCCTIWYLWQFFLIVLAFIDYFYGYDVVVWPHLGRKCAKLHCFLLVSCVYPGESHDWLLFCLTLIGQLGHMLFKLPLQFSTKLSSSGGIIFLKTRVFFDISVWFLFHRIWRSYFTWKWQCKGVNYLKIRDARGVPFMDNTPIDLDNIGDNTPIDMDNIGGLSNKRS